MNKEQLQQIRDALLGSEPAWGMGKDRDDALRILDAALAAEPQPVAWRDKSALPGYPSYEYNRQGIGEPLYTTPAPAPQREWQELSPLEMRDTLRNCAASTLDKLAPHWYEVKQFVNAIAEALRAKNEVKP